MIFNLNPIYKILFEKKEEKPEPYNIGGLIGVEPGDKRLREIIQEQGTVSDAESSPGYA